MQGIVCSGGCGGPTAGTIFLRYVVKIVPRLGYGLALSQCRLAVLAVLAKKGE